MTKAELYNIISNNKPPKKYVVDELLREHGHEVLRLPPYHCDLNPIEYIWNLIIQRVADKNIDQSERQIEKITRDAISSITAADWKKEVNHVERLQEEYCRSDGLLNERELIISLGGEESSSESERQQDDSDSNIMSGIEEINDSDDSA